MPIPQNRDVFDTTDVVHTHITNLKIKTGDIFVIEIPGSGRFGLLMLKSRL